MDRSSLTVALLLLSAAMAVTPAVTQTSMAQTERTDPKARCAQLVEFWLRHGGAKGEGSGGSDIDRKAAEVDCAAGRYERGIKTMEELLRRNGYTVPPV
jgi:hypothetical protein